MLLSLLCVDGNFLVVGDCRGGLCEEGLGYLVLDTAGSSRLQLIHHRAWLSLSAKVVAS